MKLTTMLVLLMLSVMLTVSGCERYHKSMPPDTSGPSVEKMVPEIRTVVDKNVKDPDKARRVEALLQEIVNDVKRSQQETRGFHEQLNALNANYDARPEEFKKIVEEINNARVATADKIIEKRFQIKDILSAQEWKDLTDAMNNARPGYTRSPHAS
jgi:chemotaxis regulatin CheY-phosphate phosphatase CheZ